MIVTGERTSHRTNWIVQKEKRKNALPEISEKESESNRNPKDT